MLVPGATNLENRANKMKNSIAAIVLATMASTSIAEAGTSSHSSSEQGVNPVPIENIISRASFDIIPLVMNLDLVKTTTPSSDADPMLVAWSIKSAAKKVGRGAKKIGRGARKIGRKAGRGVRRANRVIVPSEIRNAASKAKRGGRHIVRAIRSYKTCIWPGCGRIGDLPNPHDHRSQ